MKYRRFFQTLTILMVALLLIMVVPASPAVAQIISFSPAAQGRIGSTITLNGTFFTATTQFYCYFSSQNLTVGSYFDTATIFSTVANPASNASGTFTTTFTVPDKLSSNNSNVTPGTYYIYVIEPTAAAPPQQQYIKAKATFTVIGGDVTLDKNQGNVGDFVTITGSAFNVGSAITVQFGGVQVPIDEGNTQTNASGNFVSTIIVPEFRAGTHNITVTVGSYTVDTPFTVIPFITVAPQSGEAGDIIDVTGTGFARRQEPSLYLNNFPVELVSPVLTDLNGSFTASFTVPDDIVAGLYSLDVEDEDFNTASASFRVNTTPPTTTPPTTTPPTTTPPTTTPPVTPILNIIQTSEEIGAPVGALGSGFTPGAAVVIAYDQQLLTTVTASASGDFVASFEIPALPNGEYTISASDSILPAAQDTLTVTSNVPQEPRPSKPESGSSAGLPISFEWTGESGTQVTYQLQIATTDTFSNIIFDKTGIQGTSYSLSEAEVTLDQLEEPYYWRVRAIDAASNASDWSNTEEFFLAGELSFPKWALYTILAIGAVLIFGIGYWLGRRTAFYY